MKKLNRDIFIQKSKEIHKDIFNYDLVEYKNVRTKVKIICHEHGVFEQLPWTHMKGIGCSKCQNLTKENFIRKSIKIHGNKYDYSIVELKNNKTKVKIICPKHGVFEQTPNNHLNGGSCRKCFYERKNSTTENFISKSNIIHGHIYDYSLVKYEKSNKKVKIICKKHGLFEQTPHHHLGGVCCPICISSKGEKKVSEFLKRNNIFFNRQKSFDDCKNKRCLPFDFYLPDYNICIEYNGEQHYTINKHFGGIDGLNYTNKNDEIKKNYCKNKNIKLIIIRYDDDIEKILMDSIF